MDSDQGNEPTGTDARLRLVVIIGSTRSGRFGPTVAAWFTGAWARFGEDAGPLDEVACAAAAKTMLDQLAWWAVALRDARTVRPYVSG